MTLYTSFERQKIAEVTNELASSIKNHLGILENGTFNTNMSLQDKEIVGLRMRNLLDVVADGAFIPLMHFTFGSGDMLKIAALKEDMTSPLLREHLDVTNGFEFMSLSEGERNLIGQKLLLLLRDISNTALVPLLNYTLNYDQVKKLASLKGIHDDDNVTKNKSHQSEHKEEPDENVLQDAVKMEDPDYFSDTDEQMAAALSDIPQWIENQRVNHGSENSGGNLNSKSGADERMISNEKREEGECSDESLSLTDNRAVNEPPFVEQLKTFHPIATKCNNENVGTLTKRAQKEKSYPDKSPNLNQPKRMMHFVCYKCDYTCQEKAELSRHREIVHGYKMTRGKNRGRANKNRLAESSTMPIKKNSYFQCFKKRSRN